MRVRYTPQAFADRERIFAYLHERSPGGARNVMASIRASVAALRDQPLSGYPTDDSNIRVKAVPRYPYRIFYRIRENAVEIVHIRHTSRRAWRPDRAGTS